MRVWVRQSNGTFYGRPKSKATYQKWQEQQWIVGRFYTGRYQDHVWVNAVKRDGKPHLHVVIRHESHDRKPSAQSEFFFSRT